MASDDITAVESALVEPNNSPKLHPNEHSVEPLELSQSPKVRTKLRIFAILVSLYLVAFIAALDQTIVATSIPTICTALHSASGYTWIGAAYLLAKAATGPIWARCSDIWGRKPALLIAITIFAVASILAATSTSMRMLIAARALQGIGGAGLMQLVSITISDLFSVRSRALYLGLMGVMWAVAGSAGPLIGGAFTQLLSWRWCFWINLPVCGLAFVLLILFLDVHNPRTKLGEGVRAVDWFGTLSILAVTILLLLGLNFGGATFAWDSPKVICLIVSGTLMIGFFLFSEKRLAKYPLMPLSAFKDWSNNSTFLVGFAHSMVSIGIEYYLPLYFQSVKQASPLRSGILILPSMVTEAVTDILAGVVIQKTGRYREIMWTGTSLMTLGTGLYVYLQTDTSIATIVGFEILGGIGIALLFQTPTIAIQSTVSQANTATAISTLGFINNLATSLSIVLGGVVFQNSMNARQASLAAAGVHGSVLTALSGDQAAANVDIIRSIESSAQQKVVRDSFAWSLRNMFIMYTVIAGIAMVASAFIKRRHLSTEHAETKTGLKHLTEQVV
ncbi:hypothetical protein MBLNU459_g3916t1 [Dothideomycetes sp. NU459]